MKKDPQIKSIRLKIYRLIELVLKDEKKSLGLEKILFKKVYGQYKKYTGKSDEKNIKLAETIKNSSIVEYYSWVGYQFYGHLLKESQENEEKEEKKEKEENNYTERILKKKQFAWNDPCYKNIKSQLKEHDNYILNPFEVVEGVVECPKCSGKKTWSVQKQLRGGDEGMTTISHCVNCSHEWSFSG